MNRTSFGTSGRAKVSATPDVATTISSPAYVRSRLPERCACHPISAVPSAKPAMKPESTMLVAPTLCPKTSEAVNPDDFEGETGGSGDKERDGHRVGGRRAISEGPTAAVRAPRRHRRLMLLLACRSKASRARRQRRSDRVIGVAVGVGSGGHGGRSTIART